MTSPTIIRDTDLQIRIGGRQATPQAMEAMADEVLRQMEASSRELQGAIRTEYRNMYTRLARRHGRQYRNSRRAGRSSGDRLHKRSGGGLRSIQRSVRMGTGNTLNEVRGEISTGKMTTHETGARIFARRSRYLTVPMPEALDARGRPLRRNARAWSNTFVIPAKRGGAGRAEAFIVQRRGNGKDLRFLYALVPNVTIRARLGMRRDWEQQVVRNIERQFSRILSRRLSQNVSASFGV
jgi:hypothetical protein